MPPVAKKKPQSSASRPAADRSSSTFDRLRDLIVEGRLAPGTRLIEADVAERLGVSRTPVRSALHRLQQEGYIVELSRGRRARMIVAPLTSEDAAELLQIFGQLNALAGRYAGGLGKRERTALTRRMRSINTDLRKLGRKRHPDAHLYHDLDTDFHQSYVDAAAGPRLKALHGSIQPQADRYVRVYVSALTSEIGASVAEHDDIVRRIEAGDAEGAQKAIQDNWRNAAERLAGVIEIHGERGNW